MKIRVPFRMFGGQQGEIEARVTVDANLNPEDEGDEELIREKARHVAHYVGIFRDEFQRVILGHERCPGITNVFETLRLCNEDEVLRERLLELKREQHRRVLYGEEEDE